MFSWVFCSCAGFVSVGCFCATCAASRLLTVGDGQQLPMTLNRIRWLLMNKWINDLHIWAKLWSSGFVGKSVVDQYKGLSAGERAALISPSVTCLKYQNSPCVCVCMCVHECACMCVCPRASRVKQDSAWCHLTCCALRAIDKPWHRNWEAGRQGEWHVSVFVLTGLGLSEPLVNWVWVTAATPEVQKVRNERKTEIHRRCRLML